MSGIISDNTGRGTGLIKAAAGGKIGQVLQAQKTDRSTISSSSTTFQDIPGMTIAITPVATSSKILIHVSVTVGYDEGSNHMRLIRDTTPIAIGDEDGDRGRCTVATRTAGAPYALDNVAMSNSWLDSPSSTSALTYKLQTTQGTYTEVICINSGATNADLFYASQCVSRITVMEILA